METVSVSTIVDGISDILPALTDVFGWAVSNPLVLTFIAISVTSAVFGLFRRAKHSVTR